MEHKICPICNQKFYGRIDKKYCSLECKNEYSNSKFRMDNEMFRQINSILKSNNKILQKLCLGRTSKVAKEKLLQEGFNFNYFTNEYLNSRGERYLFCYNYGYLILENDICLLVQSIRNEKS